MATRAKGYEAKAGFKKASVWETAVAVGANNGLEILTESLQSNVELARDESFNGSPVPYPGAAGNETVEGSLEVNLKYEDNVLVMLAMLMGTAGTPVGAGDPYTHTLKLAAGNDGLFGTLVLDRGFEVWEYANVKPTKVTLAAALADYFVKTTVDFLGYSRSINTSTGTNNNTTIETVTVPYATKELVKPGELTVWINDNDGADFADGDKFCVSEFSLEIARQSEADRTTCTQGRQSEPVDNGFATVMGSLTVPAYEDGMRTLIDDCQNKTVKKMKWVFDAGTHQIEFWFPAVQLTNDGPSANTPGKLPLTLNFDCFRSIAVPTGFGAVYGDTFYAVVVNARATDLLS